MNYYKIGPVVIEMERAYANFDNFKLDNTKGIKADVTITFQDKPHDMVEAEQVGESLDIIIWKVIDRNGSTGWIFESTLLEEKASLWVSRDYKKASYYSELKKDNSGYYILLSRVLQPYISILAIKKNIIVFHAACINKNGKAVAFCGKSGIGKSTRAKKWISYLGAEWISGDRPWIDPINCIAIGTPWDGKEQIFYNVSVPLIVILEVKRSEKTRIYRVDAEETFQFVASQAFIPLWDSLVTAKVFQALRIMVKNIPHYKIFCDITKEATIESYEIFYKNILKGK